jgi:membrane associated rhomboid family serine protease
VGVSDRTYMRRRAPPPIALGTSWTLRLVVFLFAAFLAVHGARAWAGWRGEWALVLSRDAIVEGRWWTILTAALLHVDPIHLLFNLIGLWYFGKLVEETLGGARYLAFFWIAAAVSHAPFLAAEFATGGDAATVGASGIVTAMLVFAAFRYPGMPCSLFGLPLVLWQLAALYFVLDAVGVITRMGATDHWTHLGGAAFGWSVHRFDLLSRLRLPRRAPPREPGPYAAGNAQTEIDRLLDKIAADGIGSLTDDEREFLRSNSGRYR